MTLRAARCAFTKSLAQLLQKMEAEGYEAAIDWVRRTPACLVGKLGVKSCHNFSLAADINLYHDGVWLSATEAHRPFGEWWEQQHRLARWGGRFQDGNHYSFEWQGSR